MRRAEGGQTSEPCWTNASVRYGGLVVLLLLGCATAPAPKAAVESKPIADFPSPATLAEIAARPAPPSGPARTDQPVRDWTVDGAGTASAYGDRWKPVSPWDQTFAAAVSRSGRELRLTQAMSCLARELGRFNLEAHGSPSHDLEQWMAGACGAISVQIGVQAMGGEVPAKATEQALLARWGGQLQSDLLARVPKEASEAGFWFGRRGKEAVAFVAYSSLDADVLPFSLVPDAKGEITIQGEARQASEYFDGFANRGKFGVEPCLVDPSIHRPRFRFVCRLDPADEIAWIDLAFAPPKRVVAEPFARVLARRTPGQTLLYRATTGVKPQPIAREEEFAPAVLLELNRTRQEAGLAPVRLAEAQSGTGLQLAKRYFAAGAGEAHTEEIDTIALGMLAGWQVPGGMIRDGRFVSAVVPRSNDAGYWLSTALSLPMARGALLDPQIEEVAFGPALLAEAEGLGAITSGYRFYHGNDHSQDIVQLFKRVVVARRRLSAPPPRRLAQMESVMREELARVYEGKAQPMEALEAVLDRGTRQYLASMRGYLVEAMSLEALEIPEDVLKLQQLDLEFGVTHHKPKGAAWGQLVIFVVFIDHGETRK